MLYHPVGLKSAADQPQVKGEGSTRNSAPVLPGTVVGDGIAAPGPLNFYLVAHDIFDATWGHGARVSADYASLGYYHPEAVAAVHSDGTYDLIYDDGLTFDEGTNLVL